MVAMSFASDAEANIFYKTVTATIANRSKKRRSRKFSPTKTDGSQDTGYDSGVILRNQNSTGKKDRVNFATWVHIVMDT